MGLRPALALRVWGREIDERELRLNVASPRLASGVSIRSGAGGDFVTEDSGGGAPKELGGRLLLRRGLLDFFGADVVCGEER